MTVVRMRATVRGRVQGVFFRDTTRERASDLGLAGWVRNCADGSLEAVFEGPGDRVRQAIEFLREGPPQAQVEAVDVADEEPHGLDGFTVR